MRRRPIIGLLPVCLAIHLFARQAADADEVANFLSTQGFMGGVALAPTFAAVRRLWRRRTAVA